MSLLSHPGSQPCPLWSPPCAPFGDMGTPGPWGRGTGAVRPGRNFQSQKAPGKEKLRRADTVPTELPGGGGAVGFQLPCPAPPPLLPGDVGSGFCPAGGSGEPPPTPEPTPSPFHPHFVPISSPFPPHFPAPNWPGSQLRGRRAACSQPPPLPPPSPFIFYFLTPTPFFCPAPGCPARLSRRRGGEITAPRADFGTTPHWPTTGLGDPIAEPSGLGSAPSFPGFPPPFPPPPGPSRRGRSAALRLRDAGGGGAGAVGRAPGAFFGRDRSSSAPSGAPAPRADPRRPPLEAWRR